MSKRIKPCVICGTDEGAAIFASDDTCSDTCDKAKKAVDAALEAHRTDADGKDVLYAHLATNDRLVVDEFTRADHTIQGGMSGYTESPGTWGIKPGSPLLRDDSRTGPTSLDPDERRVHQEVDALAQVPTWDDMEGRVFPGDEVLEGIHPGTDLPPPPIPDGAQTYPYPTSTPGFDEADHEHAHEPEQGCEPDEASVPVVVDDLHHDTNHRAPEFPIEMGENPHGPGPSAEPEHNPEHPERPPGWQQFWAERRRLDTQATEGRWGTWAMQVWADRDGSFDVDKALPVATTYYMDSESKLRTWDADYIVAWQPSWSRQVANRVTALEQAVYDALLDLRECAQGLRAGGQDTRLLEGDIAGLERVLYEDIDLTHGAPAREPSEGHR